jgi:hypothetical protein
MKANLFKRCQGLINSIKTVMASEKRLKLDYLVSTDWDTLLFESSTCSFPLTGSKILTAKRRRHRLMDLPLVKWSTKTAMYYCNKSHYIIINSAYSVHSCGDDTAKNFCVGMAYSLWLRPRCLGVLGSNGGSISHFLKSIRYRYFRQ